ncbi:uncharacterized protein LOC111065691 [Drosophila obscura]|uniref:uncharacterized protein LOC111065691 n=1 Tax=Drosophila obscura TaxID=7282 RepID=UPI001BB2B4DE|nr:uncharacterized protein LOC111065691 [Drosophila obscura]
MKMIRSNRRKVIEEVYGSKLEGIHSAKSQAIPQAGRASAQKTGRNASAGGGAAAAGLGHLRPPDTRIQRSFMTDNDYYIQTNLPLTAANLRNNPSILAHSSQAHLMPGGQPQPSPYSAMNTRRSNMGGGKITGRQSQIQKVAHFAMPDGKVNNSVYSLAKPKEHSHPHPHQQRHSRALSKSVTQRTNYGDNNNADTELSDKDMLLPSGTSGSVNKRRTHQHTHHMPMEMPIQMSAMQPHPPQHQLHQQQLTHHSSHQHQNVAHSHAHAHPHQHPQHPHQKHTCPRQLQSTSQPRVSAATDDDKDDDPEEFFELIRQTVQTAIGNTINETLFKNFRDLGTKIERFSGELKQTNEHLDKLQETVAGKLVHYGEENSRHFRYLCMKSEYDKMFFQHQAMLTNPSADSSNPSQQNVAAIGVAPTLGGNARPMSNQKFNSKAPKRSGSTQERGKMPTSNTNKVQNPCTYRTTSKAPHQQQTTEPHKSSSDQSLGQSSQLGVAEVLGHIQRFCTQIQQNDMGSQNQMTPDAFNKMEASLIAKAKSNVVLGLCGTDNKPAARTAAASQKKTSDEHEGEMMGDSMDEAYSELEDFQMSSDEMTSCSDDDDCGLKYPSGAVTSRAPAAVNSFRRQSNNGAGDGQ